jgi:hypothetical protein
MPGRPTRQYVQLGAPSHQRKAIMDRSRFAAASLLVLGALVSAPTVRAQSLAKPAVAIDTHCCVIVAINARTGVATAKVLATGATFDFSFGWFDPKLGLGPVDGLGPIDAAKLKPAEGFGPIDAVRGASSLHVGQKIWANMKGRVSVDGVTACCGVVAKLGSGSGRRLSPPDADYRAHVDACNSVAASTFPHGGHSCVPLATIVSTGTNPDGSDATWSWTCVCS